MTEIKDVKDGIIEKWRDIPGWKNLYQASTYGRIRNLSREVLHYCGGTRTVSGKVLTPVIGEDKYYEVCLSNKGVHKSFRVSRLVALTFIPNPNNYLEVNHINENIYDNTVDNLEWCDRSYNINHGTRNKRVAEKLSKKVAQYDLNGNLIKIWNSTQEIQRILGYHQANISGVCLGKRNKAHNFIWKYYDRN